MTVLRELFEALGFTNVATFIASGNVIFDTATSDTVQLRGEIERQLEKRLGYEVATFLRSPAEVATIAAYEPFPNAVFAADAHTLSIMLLADPPPHDLQRQLAAFETPRDAFHVHDREIYWLCRAKTTESLVDWALLGRTLTLSPVTVRNATTIRKLAAKYPPA